MNKWQKVTVIGITALAVGALSGCEDEESNDLAQAQACMDNITSANYASAAACMTKIAKYDSQQANILKCSISFLSGGLTTHRVSEAYKQIALTSTAVNNQAVFMTVLALSPASLATTAQAYCERSQIKGLIYLANLSVMGSTLAAFITLNPAAGNYNPTDPTSPPPSAAEVNQAIDSCRPPSGSCGATQYTSIGESILTINQTYCVGENADTAVCQSFANAITGSGGSPTVVAKQLLCHYATPSKLYNFSTGNCYP